MAMKKLEPLMNAYETDGWLVLEDGQWILKDESPTYLERLTGYLSIPDLLLSFLHYLDLD